MPPNTVPFSLKCLLGFFLLQISVVNCLYEDQIGKFDWRQSYVGKIKYGYLDPITAERAIVGTEDNVIASISCKNGEINWRRVLEEKPRGELKYLYMNQNTKNVMSQTGGGNPLELISVSGTNPALIRGWDISTGNLAWEWNLMPLDLERADDALWFFNEVSIYHVLPIWNSHLELTEYHASSGQQMKSATSKISASWITKDKCVLSKSYFACLVKNQLLVIDLTSEGTNVKTQTIEEGHPIEILTGRDGYLKVGRQIINLKDNSIYHESQNGGTFFIDSHLVKSTVSGDQLKISTIDPTSGQIVADLSTISDLPENLNNNPKVVGIKCKTKPDTQIACRVLLSTDDGAIFLVQQGKIKWVREEALTRIADVDFLDLSLSDAQGAMEEELNNKDAGVLGSLVRRLHSQYYMMKNIFLHVIGLGAPPSESEKYGLVRDDFGLHKMIVIVTESGKIFGIDNISGKQHWVKFLPNFGGFNNGQSMKLLVQRTSKYYPLPAQCAVIARHKKTGNGLIFKFNPIVEGSVSGEVQELDYQIQQISLLHESGADFLKGILIIDQNNQVHMEPASSIKQVDKFHFYIANKNTGVLSGFFVEYDEKFNKPTTIPTWTLSLGGFDNTQKITNIASKNPIERVHSQGHVLADRSVLYKYINPNLVAIATQGPDSIHKYILNIYLVDVVSGAIVFSMSHKRAKGPVHMVHSENWIVYSFYNEKVRRHEITTMELYEGKTQANSTVWSSLQSPPTPLVERQTYIIPTHISALRETITEKGITTKHLLMGLTSGGVVEMSWALLNPRRNSIDPPEKLREEGIIPYIPELPIQHETIINYNQSVTRINGIHTAPSGLESTCLVIAYGLDIFVTRVSPSKTFDLLKEDFDYFVISLVLIGLTTASYITKYLSSRKAIKQAWK